ncbi:MAG: pilin [Candidatus Magasanikbacteria bacterium]
MYLLAKLAQYKKTMTVLGVFALSLAFAPMASAQYNCYNDPEDPFCTNKVGAALGGRIGGEDTDFITSIVNIINIMLGLLGLIAVVIILLGGFKWMTAGGSDEKVTEARKLIFSGIIGLAIILSAWAIAQFVIGSLRTATQGTDEAPI